MCIIVYKPKGEAIPETLKQCWTNNSDGAGYAVPKENGEIKIKKGFMSWRSFEQSVRQIKNPEAKDILFHFRIATHGGVNKEFTHPFPLSDKMHHLKAIRCTTPMAICHNGIISEFGSKTLSDTADYIANVAYPLFKATKMEQNEYTDEVIQNTIEGSRFAIMTKNGVRLIGDWYKHDGCFYSNEHYKPYAKYYYGTKAGTCGYGYGYDYEDDYEAWSEAYGYSKSYPWSYTTLYTVPIGEKLCDMAITQVITVTEPGVFAIDDCGVVFSKDKDVHFGNWTSTNLILLNKENKEVSDEDLKTATETFTELKHQFVYDDYSLEY